MPTSYTNHYLRVDLTTGQCSSFSLSGSVLDRYVGGKGVGAYLLAQHQDPKAAPYAPTNPLIFVVGPLTGTQAPSMRSCFSRRSPTCSPTRISAASSGKSEKPRGTMAW